MRYGNLQNENRIAAAGRFRRAVTLIEMLIVVFIISLLAVVALRVLPGEDQRPRETARILNGYISMAKNQAVANGLPAGFFIRPSATLTYNKFSTLVEQCEVPPTYSGESYSTQLMAQDWTMVPNTGGVSPPFVPYCLDGRPVIKLLIPMNEFAPSLIRYGDKIQINGQGPTYTICWDGTDGLYSAPPASYVANGTGKIIVRKNPSGTPPPGPSLPLLSVSESSKQWPPDYNFPLLDKNNNPDPNGYISCFQGPPVNANTRSALDTWIDNYCVTCYLDPTEHLSLPWPKANSGSFYSEKPPVSFTITRQPDKSATATLQLPTGAGIDYTASGVDNGTLLCYPDPTLPAPNVAPLAIMFSPTGSVDCVYFPGCTPFPFKPTQTIYLLVGKLTVSSEADNNWFDLRNIIVSVNPQTGSISTNPVYPPYFNTKNAQPYPLDPPANLPNQFDPGNPPTLNLNKPLTDPVNANYIQALFYSRKFARDAQTMGGKR